MKRLWSVLTAIALLSGAAALTAQAAKPDAGYSADQLKRGAADAPAVIAAAKLNCQVKSAAFIASGTIERDKKPVKTDSYEVACGDGTGYMILKLATGAAESYGCLIEQAAYDAAVAAKKPTPPKCQLPENSNPTAQFQPAVEKLQLNCPVTKAAYVGSSPTTNRTFYEVACSDGASYVLAQQAGGDVSAMNCQAATAQLSYTCKFSTKEVEIAQLGREANLLDKGCQTSNARYLGATKSGHVYYEIGCTGRPGFVLDTLNEKPLSQIDCLNATELAGGCQFTDAAAAKQSLTSYYTQTLRSHNVACTQTDFKVLGLEKGSNRDVIEFKCSDRPMGLMTLMPKQGSGGKLDYVDCMVSPVLYRTPCTLTPKSAVLATLSQIVSVVHPCQVTNYRDVGLGGQGEWVELKCAAGGGYMAELRDSRQPPPYETLNCEQAGRPNSPTGPCELKS